MLRMCRFSLSIVIDFIKCVDENRSDLTPRKRESYQLNEIKTQLKSLFLLGMPLTEKLENFLQLPKFPASLWHLPLLSDLQLDDSNIEYGSISNDYMPPGISLQHWLRLGAASQCV